MLFICQALFLLLSRQRENVRFGFSLKLALGSSYDVVLDYVFSKGDLEAAGSFFCWVL